jgi:hypothetical protein
MLKQEADDLLAYSGIKSEAAEEEDDRYRSKKLRLAKKHSP